MSEYRIYELDAANRIVRRHEIEADSDLDAAKAARKAVPRHSVEIWEFGRRVCILLDNVHDARA